LRHFNNFNKSAATYAKNIDVQSLVAKELAQLIKQNIPTDKLIIDVGCGNANIKSQLPKYNIIGIDAAFNMCEIASEFHATICAEATALPFADKAAENIISSLCLQWVAPFESAINEIARCLSYFGTAAIAILSHETMWELRHIYEKLSIKSRLLNYMADEEIGATIEQAGLKIIKQKIEKYCIYHENAWSFFKQLKAIGAHQTGNNQPLTLRELGRIINLYEADFMQKQGLPVTYMVSYFIFSHHS
jgi:malonyl-CoA O-methyltransferase